jgi:membrane associated rhomboid family serine protease
VLTRRRTFAAAALSLSILGWTGFLPISWLVFHPYYLWKFPPEIWRLPTSFLLTGPKMSILFDTYFLYQYMSQLEMGHPKFPRKEDLLWYLLFVSGVVVVGVFFLFLLGPINCLLVAPRISARIVDSYSYSGSWKRGRSPLHLGQPIIRKTRGLPAVWAWWESNRWLEHYLSVCSSGFSKASYILSSSSVSVLSRPLVDRQH